MRGKHKKSFLPIDSRKNFAFSLSTFAQYANFQLTMLALVKIHDLWWLSKCVIKTSFAPFKTLSTHSDHLPTSINGEVSQHVAKTAYYCLNFLQSLKTQPLSALEPEESYGRNAFWEYNTFLWFPSWSVVKRKLVREGAGKRVSSKPVGWLNILCEKYNMSFFAVFSKLFQIRKFLFRYHAQPKVTSFFQMAEAW